MINGLRAKTTAPFPANSASPNPWRTAKFGKKHYQCLVEPAAIRQVAQQGAGGAIERRQQVAFETLEVVAVGVPHVAGSAVKIARRTNRGDTRHPGFAQASGQEQALPAKVIAIRLANRQRLQVQTKRSLHARAKKNIKGHFLEMLMGTGAVANSELLVHPLNQVVPRLHTDGIDTIRAIENHSAEVP
jgi:hypothetical protein